MNVVVLGLPGSGKTYFANKLASAIGGLHISSDVVRQQMQQRGKYHKEAKMAIYDEMLKLMEKATISKENAVLDATFYKEYIRNIFKEKARLLNSNLYFIEIRATESIIKKRISKKREESEADFTVYLKIKSEFEAVNEYHLVLYSDKEGPDEMLDKALAYINYANGTARD